MTIEEKSFLKLKGEKRAQWRGMYKKVKDDHEGEYQRLLSRQDKIRQNRPETRPRQKEAIRDEEEREEKEGKKEGATGGERRDFMGGQRGFPSTKRIR